MKSINWKSYFLTIIFIAFFLDDAINKYSIYYDQFQLKNVVLFIKIPIITFLVIAIVFSKNSKAYSLMFGVVLLVINFIIGNYSLSTKHTEFVDLLYNNFKTLVWYLMIFIFIGFYHVVNKNLVHQNLKKLLYFIDYFVLFQCLSVLIGLVTDVYYFKSYGNSRFGYSGIFINVMQGNYIYILLLLIYLFKIFKDNTLRDKLFFCCLIVFSSFIGTKNILLFNVLLINYYLYNTFNFIRISKINKMLCGIISAIGVLIGIYFIVLKSNLYNILVEKGIFNSITSNRYSLVKDSFIPFVQEKWSFLNYIFGGAYFHLNRMEFEILDFIWFFGILGTIIYFSLINKYLIKIKYFVNCMPLLFLTLIFSLTGSFFSSLTTVLVFTILIIYILENKLLINNE